MITGVIQVALKGKSSYLKTQRLSNRLQKVRAKDGADEYKFHFTHKPTGIFTIILIGASAEFAASQHQTGTPYCR